MKLRSAAVVAGLALGVMSGAAQAATYSFSITSTPDDGFFGTASGTFVTDSTGLVTSLTGTQDVGETGTFYAISLLGQDTYASNDNLFSPVPPYFDFSGISYVADGVSFNVGAGFYQNDANDLTADVNITVSPVAVGAVPLPASAPMFGAALLALGVVGYGLKRKKAAAAA